MEEFREILKKAGAFFTAIILALTSLSFGNNLFIKKDPDVKLTVALMSDTHVGDVFYRKMVFRPGVRDVSRHVKPDVLLVAGDCTDNGNADNWAAFKGILDKNMKINSIVLAMGNHDSWASYDGGERSYAEAKATYLEYSNAIMGTDFSEVYASRDIGGYPFLVLGSEADTTGATISAVQLDWLETALKEAAASHPGKPIFVVNHQPLNYTHAVGNNEHGEGFESNEISMRLQSILDQYENIFLISGHRHHPLTLDSAADSEGFATIEQVGAHITSINLPCYEYGTFLEGGTSVLGEGIVMYVFSDKVEFKGRNYFLSNWSRNFDVEIPLRTAA